MLMFSFVICFGVSVASSWTAPLHTVMSIYSVWGWLCVKWRSHDGRYVDFVLQGCDTVCYGSQSYGRRCYSSLKEEKAVYSETSMYLCTELWYNISVLSNCCEIMLAGFYVAYFVVTYFLSQNNLFSVPFPFNTFILLPFSFSSVLAYSS